MWQVSPKYPVTNSDLKTILTIKITYIRRTYFKIMHLSWFLFFVMVNCHQGCNIPGCLRQKRPPPFGLKLFLNDQPEHSPGFSNFIWSRQLPFICILELVLNCKFIFLGYLIPISYDEKCVISPYSKAPQHPAYIIALKFFPPSNLSQGSQITVPEP